MSAASQTAHWLLRNPAFPYKTFTSVVSTDPQWIAGSNILTTLLGEAEMRPGFSSYVETTPVQFTGTVENIHTWRRWSSSSSGVTSGAFFIMLSVNNGVTSDVWKIRLGTDVSFSLIYSGTSGSKFYFVDSNNFCFFGNGSATDMQKYDGTTVTNWGITAPASAPTFATGGTGIDAAAGYYYRTTFYNTNTGHESNVSPESACTGVFTNDTVTVTLVSTTTDTQVTHWRLYRTTDAGSRDPLDMRLVATTVIGTTTYADSTLDENLSDTFGPGTDRLGRPPGLIGFAKHAGRIAGFANNKVYWSGFEENANGVPEESWWTSADGNFRPYAYEVNAVASLPDGIAVYQGDRIDKIEGDSLDTLRYYKIADMQGSRSQKNVAEMGGINFWFDTDDQIWMLGGNEVGMDIRPDLAGANHANTSLLLHLEGVYRWLIWHDGEQMLTFDLDSRQWMPPWTVVASAIHSGETAVGHNDLLACVNGYMVKLVPGTFNDRGTNYAAYGITNLFEISPKGNPDWRTKVVNVHTESDADGVPDSVHILTDDDPFYGAGFQSLTATDMTQRTQGTYLKDKVWQSVALRLARRAAMKFVWDADGLGFKLYSISLGHQPQGV